MPEKINVVLDIAGVIATNFSPTFWSILSNQFNIPYDDLVIFKDEIRNDLWTGAIVEEEFWYRLTEKFPTIDADYANDTLLTTIKPLPARELIPEWSKYADIHLLSNHRKEWLNHIIEPIQDNVNTITISSEVGFCKPQSEIFLKAAEHINLEKKTVFIDDQEKNLIVPHNLGWHTFLADKNGDWVQKVDQQFIK